MSTETVDQSKNDKHVKTSPETPCGSGSSKHSNSDPEVIDGSQSSTASEEQIDVINRCERALKSDKSDCSKTYTNGTGSILDPTRRLSSASSPESSLDDVFKVETVKFESQASRSASKDEQNDVSSDSSASKDEQVDVSSDSSAKSKVDNYSPVPTSTWLPPTVSPPVQVMDLSGGYDPKRIPSSVFARSTSPMEWSTNSNESLFSIQLGNNSFSQEHAFMFSELYKSGELTKSGEFCMFSPHPFDIIPEDIEIDRKSAEVEDLKTNEILEEAFKSEERFREDQNKGKNSQPVISCNLSNVSGHSRCSGTSNFSFAFPILTEMERNSSAKTDVPARQSDEDAYALPKNGASEVAPHSTATCCNWFRCFSWSSCWTWGKCYRCRCSCCC